MSEAVLVHLGAGIGNIVLATPLLVALSRTGLTIDVWLSADYAQTAELFEDWGIVRRLVGSASGDYRTRVPAIPPFYWPRFHRHYARLEGVVDRPPDALFYEDEQQYYMTFARTLGYDGPAPSLCLPVAPADASLARSTTVVLAPGCKTGEMATKRWPYFPELANRFPDVVIVGTPDDLRQFDGTPMPFPSHARVLVGQLTLRQTAELMAAAGVVVANDSGLAHVAAAVGVPTIQLFGPTPDRALGQPPSNVTILRAGLPCEPCWFGRQRFAACERRVDCLRTLSVSRVAETVSQCISAVLEPIVT